MPLDAHPRFVVGIDLGTTNSALAFVDTEKEPGRVRIFPVAQLIAPGEIEARDTLPSFHYEPGQGEGGDDRAWRMPWDDGERSPPAVVGVLARDRGADAPGRLIVSAKSWLCHPGVDRTAELLPWHAAPHVKKLSPADASARYLAHLRAAWNHAHPEHPLESQDVVVTIPASFDEIARELTVTAARRAGLNRVVLLEEPQAAFYAWAGEHRELLEPGQTILVCDIGGGTTDFSLIEARTGGDERIRFHRVAVGDHLILGGDNLDLALAHHVEQRLGATLEPRVWGVVVRRCQQAKEILLGPNAPERWTLSLPAAAGGARLIGGARRVELTRDEATTLLVDGFLPKVDKGAHPARRASGFQEFGLPYAPDPAMTRYLAAFLQAHGAAPPDAILFNGGFFESPALRERLLEVMRSWWDTGWQPALLRNPRLDLAVALGAARFGLARRGVGLKISAGLARAYYLGVRQGDANAALCLVPAGLEEGSQVELTERQFDVHLREPVEFPLYVSSARANDAPGTLVPLDPEQLTPLPPIRTALRGKVDGAQRVPVRLHARLTEVGTLEVWCTEVNGKRQWKLPFDVRAATRTDAVMHETHGERAGFLDEASIAECRALIREAFSGPASAAETLVKRLEAGSGLGRLQWPPSLLRNFWEELLPLASARGRGPAFEARWLNLLGFALRPGYGFAVDDWRAAQTWRLFESKIVHPRNELCRAEWWILWRRIAGGLTAGQQRALAAPLLAELKKHGGAGWGRHETKEVWRLLGSLEWLDAETKIELGERLLSLPELYPATAWALGRLGARVPMYGPLNTVIPPEAAEAWIARLLSRQAAGEEITFALVQLARRTGDRYRDISEPLRESVLARATGANPRFEELVRAGGNLRDQEQDALFGETLPLGLRLVS